MFTALITSLINIVIGILPLQVSPADAIWAIDKDQVFVGGCVTVIFEGSSHEIARLMLRVGNRPGLKAVDSWPTVRRGGKTYVLLSHDFFNREGLDRIEGTEDGVRMVPLFHSPSTVSLTLRSGNVTVGIRDVRVVEPPEGSGAAIDLLFPRLLRNKGVSDPAKAIWIQLITKNTFPVTPEQVQQLRDELPIIMKHPDWGEIASMAVANAEANIHYKDTIEACRQARDEGREMNTEPPVPAPISDALMREPKSPFAKAIQDGIRKTIAARQWIPSLIEVATPDRP